MKHLMIEIEAMDDKPTAAILAVAAAFFNPKTGEVGKTFYRRISLDDAIKNGGTVSAEMIAWYLKQSADTREKLLSEHCQDTEMAMYDFFDFVNTNMTPLAIKVWYGCPSLRSAVLRTAMNRFGGEGFEYGNEQSVVTINELAKSLGLNMESIIPYSESKNAYDQVVYNIKVVSYIWMYLDKIASVK